MKNKIKQMFTIVGFFTTAMSITLLVSWSMSTLFIEDTCQLNNKAKAIIQNVKSDIQYDIKKSFKYLIPKI